MNFRSIDFTTCLEFLAAFFIELSRSVLSMGSVRVRDEDADNDSGAAAAAAAAESLVCV
jgi:hypothetical protein